MGSMGGHVLQAIIFVALGTWHLSAFFATYLKAPRDYIAHAWYPVSGFSGRLKHLELYLMLLFLPLAIFYDLGISMQFQPLVNGAMPWSSIVGFEHVTILFMFWMFALIVLVSDTTSALPFPPEGSFLFASLAFSLQWMSIQHGANLTSDLERQCYTLLAYTAAVCAVSSGLLAIRPRVFLVNLVLCLALILQGTWQFQVAMSLYSERFIPLGCRYNPSGTPGMNGAAMFSSTQCDLPEMIVRAVALMNFAFNCHVIAVVFFSVFIFAVVAKVYGHRRVTYDPISSDFDSEAMQLKSMAATNKLSFERR